nr:hypothetical protein [Candidatus Sigynarchaeota archaeon]
MTNSPGIPNAHRRIVYFPQLNRHKQAESKPFFSRKPRLFVEASCEGNPHREARAESRHAEKSHHPLFEKPPVSTQTPSRHATQNPGINQL